MRFSQTELRHPVFRIRVQLIRIQHFRLNTDPDPGFEDKIFKNKFTAENVFNNFLMKNGVEESLQHSKENIEHFKT
jgi:hypothetical protein